MSLPDGHLHNCTLVSSNAFAPALGEGIGLQAWNLEYGLGSHTRTVCWKSKHTYVIGWILAQQISCGAVPPWSRDCIKVEETWKIRQAAACSQGGQAWKELPETWTRTLQKEEQLRIPNTVHVVLLLVQDAPRVTCLFHCNSPSWVSYEAVICSSLARRPSRDLNPWYSCPHSRYEAILLPEYSSTQSKIAVAGTGFLRVEWPLWLQAHNIQLWSDMR